ncbi:MAG: response regulator transcription factor [Kiritimatiellae bacterium]|nr:response regulator transcription factor [Kiritimatiellia bacterium]
MSKNHCVSEEEPPGSTKRRKRIVVVDDHPLVLEGLVSLIRATPDLTVTGQAGCADEVWQLLETETPDLLLLDLSLPGINGIELIKDVNARYPRLRILVLSMHEESVYTERVLRAGACGYIMKHEPGSRIVEAARCVLRGELYVSPAVAALLVKKHVDGKPSEGCDDIGQLSDRELQVFTCLGDGLSSQEIAAQFGLSIKTVHTHREHIKRKLGIRNASNLVHYATQWSQAQRRQGA